MWWYVVLMRQRGKVEEDFNNLQNVQALGLWAEAKSREWSQQMPSASSQISPDDSSRVQWWRVWCGEHAPPIPPAISRGVFSTSEVTLLALKTLTNNKSALRVGCTYSSSSYRHGAIISSD